MKCLRIEWSPRTLRYVPLQASQDNIAIFQQVFGSSRVTAQEFEQKYDAALSLLSQHGYGIEVSGSHRECENYSAKMERFLVETDPGIQAALALRLRGALS